MFRNRLWAVVIVFGAAVVAGEAQAQQPKYNAWGLHSDILRPVETYRRAYNTGPLGLVNFRRYDVRSGEGEVQIADGQNQVERYIFRWDFDRDLTAVRRGDRIRVRVSMGRVSGNIGGGSPWIQAGVSTVGSPAHIDYHGLNDADRREFGQIGHGITRRTYGKPYSSEVVGTDEATLIIGEGPAEDARIGAIYVRIAANTGAPVQGATIEFWDMVYFFDAQAARPPLPPKPDPNAVRCDQYARRAYAQYEESVRQGCGYTGARWHGNYPGHYAWCLQVAQSIADAETNARDQELARCSRTRSHTYIRPTVQTGQRLDGCLHWGRECGEPAASAWCRTQGFSRATQWTIEQSVPPTLILGDGTVCNEPFCGGFASITCATDY